VLLKEMLVLRNRTDEKLCTPMLLWLIVELVATISLPDHLRCRPVHQG
jgi:hypothetical protein